MAATAFALGRRPGHGAVVEGDSFFWGFVGWPSGDHLTLEETHGKTEGFLSFPSDMHAPDVSGYCELERSTKMGEGQGSIYHGFLWGLGNAFKLKRHLQADFFLEFFLAK